MGVPYFLAFHLPNNLPRLLDFPFTNRLFGSISMILL